MRLRLFLVLLSLAAPGRGDRSSGCQKVADPDDKTELPSSFEFAGRHVLITYPPKYRSSKPSPLILVYHDKDMTPSDMVKVTKFDRPELNRNSIVVYPTGRNKTWMTDLDSAFEAQEYSFDTSGDDDPENDLFFTTNLLNHLESKFCVNTRRIYATGLGMGGGMMHQLACHTHLSRRIGAFAAVGNASFKVEQLDRLWGQCFLGRRPIPMLQIHGVPEDTYALNESMTLKEYGLLLAEEWLLKWRELNKCGSPVGKPRPSTSTKATVMTKLENGQLSESITYGGAAIKTSYRCGVWANRRNNDFRAEEKELRKISVLQYVVRGFGDGWPRAQGDQKEIEFRGNLVKPLGSPIFDTSGVVFNFFTNHRLPEKSVVMEQAKQLLYERGAKKYDEKNLRWDKEEL